MVSKYPDVSNHLESEALGGGGCCLGRTLENDSCPLSVKVKTLSDDACLYPEERINCVY